MSNDTRLSTGFSLAGSLLEGHLSLDKMLEATKIEEQALTFLAVYIWIVFAIGLPANIIIIITIIGMKVMSPATVFVTLLAFCDGMALTTKLIGHQLAINEVHVGTVLCKLEFVPNVFSTVANWVLILICVERFISVCYPLKKVYLLTKRRCFIAAAIMSSIILVFFAIIFCVMRTDDENIHLCGTKPAYKKFWITWWQWISVSLYLFVPFIAITGLTFPTIRGLYMSRRQRRSMVLKKTSSGNHTPSDIRLLKETERTERMITIMLIVAGIVFLILSLPACIYHLWYRKSSDQVVEAKFLLFKQVAYLFADLSHAVNFFLYFFTAKRFRSFAFKIFCPCFERKCCGGHGGPGKKDEENNSGSSRATVSTKVNMHADSPD